MIDEAGLSISDNTQLITAIVVLAVGVFFWRLVNAATRRLHDRQVFRTFGLDPSEYRLESSDVGGRQGRVLSGCGLIGAPDALFRRISDGHVIVGEFKGRRHRGHVRPREHYQITGYMGLAKRRFRTTVEGRLAYRDKVVETPFDSALFEEFVGLVPEYREARRRWKVVNRTPLAAR